LCGNARIERHQTRAGVDQDRVTEGLNNGDTFGEITDLFGHAIHGGVGGTRINYLGG
ncbi:MAG: hypothetical protein ACI88C_001775, partial [Acidimicrobiales bacterium]